MNTSRALPLFLALALLALVFLAVSAPPARAADSVIVRVTTGGMLTWPCGDQSNWSNPCALQTALINSVSGTELWVATGTYKPTAGADRAATFQLRNGVALYGGFAGGETVRSQRNLTANVTILSGDIGVLSDSFDNAYHVVTGSGVANTAVLDGFTVAGGNANGSDPNDRGGGMYNVNGSPTLANIIFFGNTASLYAGGMFNSHSTPTLTNVTFSSNSAFYGGGIYNFDDGNPTLTNVMFNGNSAGANGGGMHNHYSHPTLTYVSFIQNNVGTSGGGIFDEYSSPTLANVTFRDNSASFDGGAMSNLNESSPTLVNVTFWDNSASFDGGAMYNVGANPMLTNVTLAGNIATEWGGGIKNINTSLTIRNSIIWGNAAPRGPQFDNSSPAYIYDSIVQGGCPALGTCTRLISTDPLLGALGNWGGATQTIRLLRGSSAIDAGDDATCASTDQRGKPRVGKCDIGAFEYQGYTLTKTGGDPQSTWVNSSFGTPLQVQLNEIDSGLVVPSATITFTAPSSGPSAAWSGSFVQTATTNASGVATVAPPTANSTVGSYAVTANTSGAAAPVTFALTNTKANSTTLISSSENPAAVGHPVTFVVTVSAAPASVVPTGSVAFNETTSPDLTQHGTRSTLASQPLIDGVATFTVPSLTPGAHTFLAIYDGDASCNGSTSAVYTQSIFVPHYGYLPLIKK